MDSINKNDLDQIRKNFLDGLEEDLYKIKSEFLKEIEQLTDKKMDLLKNSTNHTIVKNTSSSTSQSKQFINGKEVSPDDTLSESVIDGKALSDQIIQNVQEQLKNMNDIIKGK